MGYTKEQRAAKLAIKMLLEDQIGPTVSAVLGGAAAETYYSPERIEQRSEGKLQATPGVEMIKDEWYQNLDAGRNALDEAVDLVREPGFRYRGINPKSQRSGQARGWEPVHDKAGKIVKVGNLELGRMPESRANARNAHYRKESTERAAQNNENFNELIAKAAVDTGGALQVTRGDVIKNF